MWFVHSNKKLLQLPVYLFVKCLLISSVLVTVEWCIWSSHSFLTGTSSTSSTSPTEEWTLKNENIRISTMNEKPLGKQTKVNTINSKFPFVHNCFLIFVLFDHFSLCCFNISTHKVSKFSVLYKIESSIGILNYWMQIS